MGIHPVEPRGPLSADLLERAGRPPHAFRVPPLHADDPLSDEDLHLTLYLCYELHYRGLPGVDDRWEWEPSLVGLVKALEDLFERALRAEVGPLPVHDDLPGLLRAVAEGSRGPSVATFLERDASLEHFREFLIHRSAYHLKEADPHSWSIPRLEGRAKAAMLEIQIDEYGAGSATRMHSALFAETLRALGLDPSYGAYVGQIPGVTLATVNLMSMFGLNRRLRGANVGHLALFEMTSTKPNRRFGDGLRRLGYGHATDFFDEHVEADAAHEMIAAHDMAGSLAADEPALAEDIVFGASALMLLDDRWATHVMDRWRGNRTSLYRSTDAELLGQA